MVIRSWRDAQPQVGHDMKIIWSISQPRETAGLDEDESCLVGLQSLALHRLQPGAEGDDHDHEDKEQVYYFTKGRGKMRIDDVLYEVAEGDAVQPGPKCRHQMINGSGAWVEPLIITATAR